MKKSKNSKERKNFGAITRCFILRETKMKKNVALKKGMCMVVISRKSLDVWCGSQLDFNRAEKTPGNRSFCRFGHVPDLYQRPLEPPQREDTTRCH